MFFEFESSPSSNQPTKDSSLAQNSIIMAKKFSSISPLAIDSSNSFLNHHLSPFSSSLSSSSTPTRHRRYSMHSFVSTTGQQQQQQSNALGTLRENIPASSNCDLALITKKKLMILTANGGSTSISTNSPFSLSSSSSSSSSSSGILNGSLTNKLKSADEGFIEPDVKLNQTFTKRSNSDLRKEVLLASIQRSLSASSEDLFAINKTLNQESSSSSMNTDSLNDDDPMDQSMNTVSQSITIPMLIQNNQNNNSSKYGSSSAIYMPSETQINQRSPTTFTSTLSMAGSIRNNHQSSPSCNYQSNNQQQQQQQQQSNNVSRLNDMMMMMGGGSGNLPYYSRGNSSMLSSSSLSQSSPSSSMANICQTVQSSPSPMRTSLMKKRMYSTSPSKPYSPPLSMNNHHQQNNKDQSISSLSSPDWETAFKRLKVMHSANVDDSNNDHSHNHQHHNHHHHHPQQEQLNELAKDFHRLKTPFT